MNAPQPPSLTAETAPTIEGAVCLVDIALQANVLYNPGDPVHLASPCGVKYGLHVVRHEESNDRRQVQFQLELIPTKTHKNPNSYLGHLVETIDVVFPRPEEVSEEDKDRAAVWLATHILIGSMRAHLDLLTGIGPYPRVTLSPVQPVPLILNAVLVHPTNPPVRLYPAQQLTEATAVDHSPEKSKKALPSS